MKDGKNLLKYNKPHTLPPMSLFGGEKEKKKKTVTYRLKAFFDRLMASQDSNLYGSNLYLTPSPKE